MKKKRYIKSYLYKRIVQAKLYVDHHYGQHIDLAALAEQSCFSKYHFIRLFRKIYGKTPHQYLIEVRIQRAAILLSTGGTVSEACYAVGFESISTFSGLFKAIIGMPPSFYAARQGQRKMLVTENPLNFIPGCYAHQYGWTNK